MYYSATYGSSLLLKNELDFRSNLLALRFKLVNFRFGRSNFFLRTKDELNPRIINTFSVINKIAGKNRISNWQRITYVIHNIDSFNPLYVTEV